MTQDAKKKEPVLGLTIYLQKYGLNTSKLQNNPVIFGFYDSLEIEPVTCWLKYSPRSSNNILYDPKNTLQVSHYPIKLHFPSPAEIDGTLEGFCYEAWKAPSVLQSKFPCMTIVLVSLTDEFINYADDENMDDALSIVLRYRILRGAEYHRK